MTHAKLDARERHFTIPAPRLSLFLRHLAPAKPRAQAHEAVLYVHGATFPSALSIAHRFDGESWRDALCEAGFSVWGLDFLGFGSSDRYPEMEARADTCAPLCAAEDAAEQLAAAVRFIREHEHCSRISLIAHSWGSMSAMRFAGEYPAWVARMVLFAPIVVRIPHDTPEQISMPAWRTVTLQDQRTRFVEDVPADTPHVLSRAHFDEWGERYLDSEPASRTRAPASVKIPAGPLSDVRRAWAGEARYDPARIHAPVCLLRGEWDRVTSREDARTLFDAFTAAPVRRDITLSRGTHLMHLESGRRALYRESICFLQGHD